MKKISVIILATCITAMACREEPKQEPYKTGMEGKPIPDFAIQLLDSMSYINSRDIPKGKKLLLFYFSPNCQFCRAQMRDMVNNIEMFKDRQLYILTNANLKSIKSFVDYFELKDYQNIVVGRDTGSIVPKKYQMITVPFTAFFDEHRNLTSAYRGRMSPNSLFLN